eukprot:TRINITY_DN22414_c0_g1_i1.p1 TRINITY_DN22414_c0_g1~~TRINITY_DN22414_c0_g1_i1.p1  ORF type:complete len:540 (+),score=109.64 TRINITY_DN22414_c0_g1_i1:159-1778(+)
MWKELLWSGFFLAFIGRTYCADEALIQGINDSEELSYPIISTPKVAPKKYAYATLHYEGTQRDEEYLLGVRVLIKALQHSGTKHDIVVIVPETVTPDTRKILRAEGAKLFEVAGIKNPYKANVDRRDSFTDRFDQTLNKLHLWNMTDYDRVVYLDADNVILESLDDLFYCGHFCAVFMNSAVFHTGMMVLKPDTRVFQDMVKKLETSVSYDGADQGFLVSYFNDLLFAPLFLGRSKEPSEDKLNRLPVNYNINHMYYYEKSSWNFYRRFHFADMRIPATSVAYPIAPNWKPWYWWPYIFLTVHWEWYNMRLLVHEEISLVKWVPFLALMATAISFELLNGYTLITLWKKFQLHRFAQHFGTKWMLVLLWFFLSTLITFKSIPETVYPTTGLSLFILTQPFLFYSLFHKITHTARNTRIKMLVVTMIILRVLAAVSAVNCTLIYRLVLIVLGLQGFFISELAILYFYCFRSIEHFLLANGYSSTNTSISDKIMSLFAKEGGENHGRKEKKEIHHCHSSDYSSSDYPENDEPVSILKSMAV